MKINQKRKKTVYYGVVGSNAYGIYKDYDLVMASKKYVNKFKCHKFTNKEEAIVWVEDTYGELEPDDGCFFYLEEIKRINWLYYTKNMK